MQLRFLLALVVPTLSYLLQVDPPSTYVFALRICICQEPKDIAGQSVKGAARRKFFLLGWAGRSVRYVLHIIYVLYGISVDHDGRQNLIGSDSRHVQFSVLSESHKNHNLKIRVFCDKFNIGISEK